MKLSLVGYGKMGHAVEKIARERGHEIVCIIDANEEEKFQSAEFLGSDAVIEFTTPATAVDNFLRVIKAGIPLVAGTTAWQGRLPEVEGALKNSREGMFWTSNFSIGVSLFRRIVAQAARLIGYYPQYTPEMTEIHHIHKLDHPSGTAVTTAEDMIAATVSAASGNPAGMREITRWTEDPDEAAADSNALLIHHKREGEVPGTHIVSWTSPVDAITIEHRAFSREGFALGAVVAAEYMAQNHPRGLRSMTDLLGFSPVDC